MCYDPLKFILCFFGLFFPSACWCLLLLRNLYTGELLSVPSIPFLFNFCDSCPHRASSSFISSTSIPSLYLQRFSPCLSLSLSFLLSINLHRSCFLVLLLSLSFSFSSNLRSCSSHVLVTLFCCPVPLHQCRIWKDGDDRRLQQGRC